MINWVLFKQGLRSNYKFTLIFLGILTMYISIIISMYDPKALSVMEEFAKTMPELMAMIGMTGDSATLMGFLITYLYGFLFLVLPLIVIMGVAHSLVASHVDKGTMAYLLATPNSRKTIILTQITILVTIIISLVASCTLITIIASSLMFPGELEIGKLLIINIGLLVLHLFIGGICFLASTIVNEAKYSIMYGTGISVLFFLVQMLSNMGGKLENLKYFTFFSLFQPLKILNGNKTSYIFILVLFLGAIILYTLSYHIFKKKDLSI